MTGTVPLRLWDGVVRLSHWAFAALVPLLWWSAETDRLDLHKRLGLAMLAVLLVRLGWGLVGSDTARFARFLKGPRAIRQWLAAGKPAVAGHNPLGGWSVAAMLGLLSLQVSLGLITEDTDGLESGPLNHYVSYDVASLAREGHELVFNLLLGMIALHLAAIAWYRFARRDNLVPAMLNGQRAFDPPLPQPRMAPAWRALVLAAIAGLAVWWVAQGAPLPF